jgi:hypothetical protein
VNDVSLTMVVPSKGRPQNASRLIQAVNETAGDELERLVIAIDYQEPLAAEYQGVIPVGEEWDSWDWVSLAHVQAEPQRMGPVLNRVALEYARDSDYVGFMGDDHLPRTDKWDEELIETLGDRPGVAFGNDLAQGEKLPTACLVSSDIIRSLGYLCPPGLDHLYLDDFWKVLGLELGNLCYHEGVVIEHLHPVVGKADWDDSYQENNHPMQYAKDQRAYSEFITGRWPTDRAKLKKDLGL